MVDPPPRDVRGFAVKFYTKEGNLDLVGNNIPVFFIQDTMKFPDMFEANEAGNFPGWEFAVQLFTQEEADSFPFDHLDPTKLIPEELIPLKVIGG